MNLKTNETYGDSVTMTDVYQEFSSTVAEKYKIKQFKSRKISKKYAFGDSNIPAESEYLEIRYPVNPLVIQPFYLYLFIKIYFSFCGIDFILEGQVSNLILDCLVKLS